MTRIYHEDGTLEISGADLAKLTHVVHESDVSNLAGMAARRIAVAEQRAAGLSWSQARKAAVSAVATDEMHTVVRVALGRGANPEQAIRAAMRAAGLKVVGNA